MGKEFRKRKREGRKRLGQKGNGKGISEEKEGRKRPK
jgi:hypothetical protein